MAKKRGAEESGGGRVKKARIRAAKVKEQNRGQEQADHEKVFHFMELPGELRNRIYAHAVECSRRCFPLIYPKTKNKAKPTSTSGSNHSSLSPSPAADDPRPQIPHLSLTHSNSQIRSEFRPAWLSTHRIFLSVMPSYLKAFYPATKPSTSPFLSSHLSPPTSLRVLIRARENIDIDISPLLRHAVRFPASTLTALGMPGVEQEIVTSIQALIDNTTEAWREDVGKKRITQVRVNSRNVARPVLRVVVQERWAEPWMRDGLTKAEKTEEWVARMGLGGVAETWKLAFGVDYS